MSDRIELRLQLQRLEQLFDSLDPTPFRERDLDPRATEYIEGWARELPSDRGLALVVELAGAAPAHEPLVREAVHQYFGHRSEAARRELRDLLRTGRKSLVIGFGFVVATAVVGDLLGSLRFGILADSLVIGAWVAMWRPLDTFLYDWWPIRAEARLFDRLAAMEVRVLARD